MRPVSKPGVDSNQIFAQFERVFPDGQNDCPPWFSDHPRLSDNMAVQYMKKKVKAAHKASGLLDGMSAHNHRFLSTALALNHKWGKTALDSQNTSDRNGQS